MNEAKNAADKIHDLLKETLDPGARRMLMEHAEYFLLRASGQSVPGTGDPAIYEAWEENLLTAIQSGDTVGLSHPQTPIQAFLCLTYRTYKTESFRQ